jgi:hypothetical protein
VSLIRYRLANDAGISGEEIQNLSSGFIPKTVASSQLSNAKLYS